MRTRFLGSNGDVGASEEDGGPITNFHLSNRLAVEALEAGPGGLGAEVHQEIERGIQVLEVARRGHLVPTLRSMQPSYAK